MVQLQTRNVVRIASRDINGNKHVYYGLADIYGIGYGFAHALCQVLHIDITKKMSALTPEEIKKIEEMIKAPHDMPLWVLNRRKDVDSGKDVHMVSSDLKLRIDFDLRKMKKIKSYKGVRHGMGLPVRGQRTKSHFRTGGSVGVIKKKVAPATSGSGAKK